MSSSLFGGFRDPHDEQRFVDGERDIMRPYVRLFGALLFLAVMAHAGLAVVTLPRAAAEMAMGMMAVSMGLIAAYVASTFLPRVAATPAIDFVCLLGLAMAATEMTTLIHFGLTAGGHGAPEATIGINRMIVAIFAAIAFIGRTEWLLMFLALHGGYFLLFMERLEPDPTLRSYESLSWAASALTIAFVNWLLTRAHRHAFRLRDGLDAERAKNQEMLFNVLPPTVVGRLKCGQAVADSFAEVSVIFIDVVGSSALARRVSPGHLIDILNGFFGLADRCAQDCGVEKVKTVGDAYLAVSGGNMSATNSADAAVAFGRAVIAGLPALREEIGVDLAVRVGIHSGPVVGGVIGRTRMAYDYWGDTMNVAARIEGAALPNGIALSETAWLRTRSKADFEACAPVLLKGIGEMPVFRLRAAAAEVERAAPGVAEAA